MKNYKLSLNAAKSKYIIFHPKSKKIEKINLLIDGIEIEQVPTFNFLGLSIDQHLDWNSHLSKISAKIARASGIINRFKNFLQDYIALSIYNTLVLPHINYNITLWGHHSDKIFKQQKKAVRLVACQRYNSHIDPIFKALNLLKIRDIYKLSLLKFYYDHSKSTLPLSLQNIKFTTNSDIHSHNTRTLLALTKPKVRHNFAKNAMSYAIPNLINDTPNTILSKIDTHSRKGFSTYAKRIFIQTYPKSAV